MNRAMIAAASGMSAEQAKLDVIAGNLANADEVGFKSSAMEFAEMTDGRNAIGSANAGTRVLFTQGKLEKTNGPFDLAIDGNGLFALKRSDGHTVFTRDGQFARAADGTLRAQSGAVLEGVKIPADAMAVSVDESGRVFGDTHGGKHELLGHVKVAMFEAPDALRSLGGTVFEATQASGPAHYVAPNTRGAGRMCFGMLEKSNVSIMEAMMEVLTAQRAFEANAKGVQAADEMLRIANNINRS